MILRIRRAIEEKDEGFTLIELLVVVIIIGILAAIAIPIFLNQRRSAVDAGTESDVRNLATNVETWATANNGAYPGAVGAAPWVAPQAAQVQLLTPALTIPMSGTAGAANVGEFVTYVRVGTTAFIICGWDTNGNQGAESSAFVYDSDSGGLTTGDCSNLGGGAATYVYGS